ncbi:MAG TPA: hypothetical protein ENI76_06445 [Ignavibacteria bacterium]|nr:hypothetical protein [Ignavibacteria bacterium]
MLVAELWKLSPKFITKNGPFDSLMNYNFAYVVDKFFIARKKRITTSEFIDELQKIDKTYPKQNLDVLLNLVDSHDTERISSMIANPDRKYDQGANEQNPNYNPGKPDSADYHIQKLIAAFQMTYRGAPMIYYGDEVGMWGADDPHDRKPMVWANLKYDDEVITPLSGFKKGFGSYKVGVNENLLNFYKKIILIRNNNLTLKLGNMKFLYSNNKNDTFAFSRTYKNKEVVAAFNIGTKKDSFYVPVRGKKIIFKELINGGKGLISASPESKAGLSISLQPLSVKIYKLTVLK